MPFSAFFKWLRNRSLAIYRLLTWMVLGAGLLCAMVVISLRYWILPNVEHYRENIAQAVSNAASQRITIGRISGNWDGIRPDLVLENVTVFDHAGRPALELARVDSTLSWLSFAALEPRLYALEIRGPALDVRRDARGVISVAGIELKGGVYGGGFADWLLRQPEIAVRDATIVWSDELRGAEPLELKHVELLVRNGGDRHRFGLRAEPPPRLAGQLDLRGDITGESVTTLADWNGKLFVQLDYADIAAWRPWAPFPIEVPQGTGAVRMWLTFNPHAVTDLVADVRLANIKTRLAKDLPDLDLTELSGRVAWKMLADGFEFSTAKLGLTTQHGLTLRPADFLLRLSVGTDRKPGRGELHANALDLEPLTALADRLPLHPELRKQLFDMSPKGSLFDVVMRWSGDWHAPTQYLARGRFQNLALRHIGKVPGFSGLNGNLDGSEKGGTLYLTSANAMLDMPLVFRDPLAFDTLTAQLAWSRSATATELRFNNISLSNPHLAGTLSGVYRTAPDGRGVIDLTGNLTRADARSVGHYIPLVVGKSTRDWLDTALLAGQANEVALRLKGNLDHFPFPDNQRGMFQVVAKVTGGVLDYAGTWPRIENIAGELLFRGQRMEINARQGTILGARLAKVHAEIPELKHPDEVLRVTGEAEGPTSEFLAFIDNSPVLGMIDRFTEGMRAQGTGKLALKLEIPLRARANSRVAGTYQFINNQIVANADLPPLEQANGRLEFTESTVRVPEASGIILGGPVSITAAAQRDAAIRLNLEGRANVDNLRHSAGSPAWAHRLRGAADWRGAFVLHNKLAEFVIESNLQGIASDLPAPLMKTATEVVPLRYERKFTGPQQDQVSFSYGEIVSAQLTRSIEGGGNFIRRGTIRFGGAAAEPQRDGVWVSGALKGFDLDRWLTLIQPGTGQPSLEVVGLDVRIGEFTALNRRFHEVAVSGTAQGGVWQSTLSGREFEGAATWRPQRPGTLTARMKKLAIPASEPAPLPPEVAAGKRELPALDVMAEQFTFKDKALGKLVMLAVPDDRDWRIEKLRIENPESTLAVEGVLQTMPAQSPQSRTQVNLHLDVNDVGKLLTRLGYPEGVRRGTAKLEGTLTWAGGLQDFDYPALSGNLVVDAAKGQFVKLEPGIGKLLGILSLQALPRRISLDFRDIFSEGFAFDQIIGAVKISRGIATTENFRLQGPSARVLMTGELDLARETQNLHVRITPSVTDGVSIAGALIGGPVAGVAAFLAQKILKDPLDQFISYEYGVTGTWSEPLVSKVEPPTPSGAGRPD